MVYYLREISRGDISEINKWRNDRQIIEQLGAAFRFINEETDDSWFASYLNVRSNNVRLVTVCKESNKVVGVVYLTGIDWVSRSAEFSILIGCKDHQGKGAGKISTQAMLCHAFDDLGLNRIYLTVLTGNIRARSLYKSSGFSEEGVIREAVFKDGRHLDLILMSILASDFKKIKFNDFLVKL